MQDSIMRTTATRMWKPSLTFSKKRPVDVICSLQLIHDKFTTVFVREEGANACRSSGPPRARVAEGGAASHRCFRLTKHHAARSHKGLAGIDRPNVGPWQLSLAKAARRCHFKLRELSDSRTDGPGSEPAPHDKDSFWPISQSMPHRLRRDRARPAHPPWDMWRPPRG